MRIPEQVKRLVVVIAVIVAGVAGDAVLRDPALARLDRAAPLVHRRSGSSPSP